MWLFDKLMNRKIEGKSSLDNVEPLLEKVVVSGSNVSLPDNVDVDGKNVSFNSYDGDNPSDYAIFAYDTVSVCRQVDVGIDEKIDIHGNAIYYDFQDKRDPNNIFHSYISIGNIDNDGSPYIDITNGDDYIDIYPNGIMMYDDDTEFEADILLETNDTVRNGFKFQESRQSSIDNIPELVDSVYDFGEQSTGIQVSLSGRGKYTFTELKGSNNGESPISINIVLPSFVKEIVRVGSEATSISEDLSTPSVSMFLDADYSVDQRGEEGFYISVMITDYIAYVRYDDNN